MAVLLNIRPDFLPSTSKSVEHSCYLPAILQRFYRFSDTLLVVKENRIFGIELGYLTHAKEVYSEWEAVEGQDSASAPPPVIRYLSLQFMGTKTIREFTLYGKQD